MYTNESVSILMRSADQLEREAEKIRKQAQDICSHRNTDGTWAVYTGYPTAFGEEVCSYCGVEACYIDGWCDCRPEFLRHRQHERVHS